MMSIPFCLHNKFSHCKFQGSCRHRYSSCDTDIFIISSCDKRHPRICRYYINYGRCKFNPCSYSHAVNNVDCEKVAKIHDYIADVKRDVDELKGLVMLNSNGLKLEKTSTEINGEIDGFKEKYDLHQLKLDVSEKEFHNHSPAVDKIEKKIC